MRIALIGAAASVALVSATAMAVAQMPGGTEPPGKMQAPGREQPKAAESQHEKSQPKSSQTQPEKGQPKATERQPEKGQPKATERQPEKGQPKATERQPEKGQPKATERQPEKGQPKATERQPEKGQPKATERQSEKGQPKATERQPDGNQKSTQQDTQHNSRVQVSEQQRGGVRERLFKEGKFKKTKLNIHVNVGTRVPRSVHLLPLPVAIIDFAPAYRGYDYVVLEDETIVIVDPQSYDIVDVIPVGAQRAEGQQGMRLALSQEQMRFVAANVSRSHRANVHVRLALGAEVPRDVELLEFPADVVARAPDLDRYRYIVADNDVVVVDPHDRGVVLVITD